MTLTAVQPAQIRRTIRCTHCGDSYVPAEASICNCVSEHRTLTCPSCSQCSCSGRAVVIRERYIASTSEEMARINQERMRERRPEVVPETLKRPLVVVADDNFDLRNIVKRLLEGFGYGVVAVENGEEAWEAVQRHQPEIALLDALMPKADGREISRRIKNDPALKTKTVVMTSLYTSAAQRDEAFREFRVDGYLAKPVKSALLQETIAALLPDPAAE